MLFIAAGGPASAITPPSQMPNQVNCAPPFERGPGGQTITAGKIQVTLTAGYNYLWNAPAVGSSGGTLRICIIEYFSQITLDADTGAETGRVVAIASAAPVLDLIAASARLTTPPTPTPVPPTPIPPAVAASSGASAASAPSAASAGPSGSSAPFGTIRPPNTGDGGLP